MSLPRFEKDVNIISKLDDEPNDVGGLSAAELKAEFDKAGGLLKAFINETLLPYLEAVTGAGDIGITEVPGVTGAKTVQEALAVLKQQLDNTSTGSIPDRSLTGEKIALGAVGEQELAEDAVTAGKLADGVIDDTKISAEGISGSKLKGGTVLTAKIADKAVTTEKLNDGAVTTAKLADLCVAATKLAANSVQTAKIADGNVTAAKIAAGAVSANYTATIGTGWTGTAAPYSIDVTVTGILATDTPLIDLNPSATFATAEAEIEAWGYIYRAVTAANKITFYATEKPTVSIPVKIKAVRK